MIATTKRREFLMLLGSAAAARLWTSSFAPKSRKPRTGLVVLLARQRGSRFLRVSPMLREDLLDIVGRPYDGVNHVVLDDVHETMLDPAKSDHPLAVVGVVAQTPCDVAANLNLHSGLAEVDIAVVAQFKAHHVLQIP